MSLIGNILYYETFAFPPENARIANVLTYLFAVSRALTIFGDLPLPESAISSFLLLPVVGYIFSYPVSLARQVITPVLAVNASMRSPGSFVPVPQAPMP